MKITELKIGMLVDLSCQRAYDFAEKARIEAIGIDWAIARDDSGRPWLLEPPEEFEIYKGD